MSSVGDRIKKIRAANKLSQADFGKRLGFSRSYIGKVEQGNNPPSRKMLEAINREFDVSVDWVLTGNIAKGKIKPKYGHLRWVLESAYDGENKEQVFRLIEKEEFSLLERMVMLFTILTYLDIAVEKPKYQKLLHRFAVHITEDNVGEPCEESQKLIMQNINDGDALMKLAKFGFDYEQPGLFWYFFQIFDTGLEFWDFDICSLTMRIKLFNEEYVTYDLLRLDNVKRIGNN
ncbi:MAG: helix-turn-helix transcriptional regulator [Deltaproteobacteria bacterium]|nr:helix-turn-helix transcriptional regulator [Deltaproteobacteria bacterium]